MRSLFLLIFIFSSVTTQAFIKNADDYTQQMSWAALMKEVADKGEVAHSPVSELRSLTKMIDIEPNNAYRAIYLTTSGSTTMAGEYIVFEASLSTELWTLMADGKTWYIDQWFYYFSAKGEFRYASHNIIEKEGVTIKKLEKGVLGPIEQQAAMAKELLSVWY